MADKTYTYTIQECSSGTVGIKLVLEENVDLINRISKVSLALYIQSYWSGDPDYLNSWGDTYLYINGAPKKTLLDKYLCVKADKNWNIAQEGATATGELVQTGEEPIAHDTDGTKQITIGSMHDYNGGSSTPSKLEHNATTNIDLTNIYTVTLDLKGGSGDTQSVSVANGLPMPTDTSLQAPTKTGAQFGGYFSGEGGSGKQYYDASMNSINNWNSDAGGTIYAYWIETDNYYTVTFDSNGGTGTMGDQIVYLNEYTPLKACTFTRDGYQFAGWSKSLTNYNDCQVIHNEAAKGTTLTLRAKWVKINTSISNTYVKVGGTWKTL